MNPVRMMERVDLAAFNDEIRPQCQPVLIKGLVARWPIVAAARAGDAALVESLITHASPAPVTFAVGPPEIAGRFHYADDVLRLNFVRERSTLREFLTLLLAEAALPKPRALAAQGLAVHQCLPAFGPAHPMPLLPSVVLPRMWIANPSKVATHNDELENLACVAAGRRRFTLFPPEAIANLYLGPFELTPGGTPISMVDPTAPDFARFPRYAEGLETAQVAELEPGDALYIPYQWYHHVEALDPINILVNYWWDPARQDLGSPWDALLHGMIALRGLPADQRRAWRAAFDYDVFLSNGDPAAHLPDAARGVLGLDKPDYLEGLKGDLRSNLDPLSRERKGPLA